MYASACSLFSLFILSRRKPKYVCISVFHIFLIHSFQAETKICMHQRVPCFALYPSSQFLYYNALLSSQLNHSKGAQVFRKSTSYIKIVGFRRVTWRKFYTEDPKILGAAVQNSVLRANWLPGSVHPWIRAPLQGTPSVAGVMCKSCLFRTFCRGCVIASTPRWRRHDYRHLICEPKLVAVNMSAGRMFLALS
jgi:hypothetical protein